MKASGLLKNDRPPPSKRKASSIRKVKSSGIVKAKKDSKNLIEKAVDLVLNHHFTYAHAARKYKLNPKKVSEICKLRRKADNTSTQGNPNDTSEYEDMNGNSSNCFSDQNNSESFSSSSSQSEDEEVHNIFTNNPRTIMARKSTSPMKLPSYLKRDTVDSDIEKTIKTTARSKQKAQNRSKSNKIEGGSDSEFTNGHGNMTLSVVDYIRNKNSSSYRPENRTKKQTLTEFEKPIQVYSYLSLRQNYHPIFLNRNLSYTKKVKKPSKTSNKNVNVFDKLLKKAKLSQTAIRSSPRKSLSEQYKQKFNLNLSFQSLELSNKKVAKLVMEHLNLKKDSSSEKKIKLAAYIEIYSIQNTQTLNGLDNSSNLLGYCRCPTKLDKTKANDESCEITFVEIDEPSTLKVQIDTDKFSEILIKCSLKVLENLDNSEIEAQDLKVPIKRRKSNRTEIIELNFSGQLEEASQVFAEHFLTCSFKTNKDPKLDKSCDSSKIFLEDDSSYSFKLENLSTSARKKEFLNYTCDHTFNDESSQSSRAASPKKRTSKKSPVKHQQTTRSSLSEMSSEVNDLLDQFYSNNNWFINFSTEINQVYEPQSPVGKLNTSESHTVLSVKKINGFTTEEKKQKSQLFEPIENSNSSAHTNIIKPSVKTPECQVIYQFNTINLTSTNAKKKIKKGDQQNKILTLNKNFTCPFCNRYCTDSDYLLLHLQMNHFRFHVIEEENKNADSEFKSRKFHYNIWCDDIHDGSYLGNPYDIQNSFYKGYASCRIRPAKRTPVTYVLINKRTNFNELSKYKNLTESEITAINLIQHQQQQLNIPMQPNKLYNAQAGMERLYYHTTTTLPIMVNETEIDSDNDLDPEWLIEHTTLLMNEFADVNEGEKGIMRLWNLHLLHNNYVSDLQVFNACKVFITEQMKHLIELDLFNNFLLHLANLHDYGLLKPEEILELIEFTNETKLKKMAESDKNTCVKISPSNKPLKSFKSPTIMKSF